MHTCMTFVVFPAILISLAHSKPVKKLAAKSHGASNVTLRGSTALDNFPLIDGHNDLAWVAAAYKQNQLQKIDYTKNLTGGKDFDCVPCQQTDIPKMKAGKLGAQFWSAFVPCDTQYKDAVAYTLEVIDYIKRVVNDHSEILEFVTTADGIVEAFKKKKIASLIGVEGGHSIEYKLSVLRIYYELGVRYMTLTHVCNTPWADASPLDTNSINNLTSFGKKVVKEMNRMGMIVDLSHVSHGTMLTALNVTTAPVMFSHSSAYAIHPHHRNVRDDVLKQVKANKGVVMVNFFTEFVGLPNSTIKDVVNHINHIADVCGIDCVGIGSDYSGVDQVPTGLEDVSKFPDLFDLLRELNPERWTIPNLEKLAGRNIHRVFKEVEKVRDALQTEKPIEDWISKKELDAVKHSAFSQCTTVPKPIDSTTMLLAGNGLENH